jgi:hypothetical protein
MPIAPEEHNPQKELRFTILLGLISAFLPENVLTIKQAL